MAQKRELQVSGLQAFQRMIESWCVHLDRMCTEEAFLRTTRHTEELMNQTYTSADYLEYSLVYDVVLRRQRTNDGRERTSLRIQQMDGKTQLSQIERIEGTVSETTSQFTIASSDGITDCIHAGDASARVHSCRTSFSSDSDGSEQVGVQTAIKHGNRGQRVKRCWKRVEDAANAIGLEWLGGAAARPRSSLSVRPVRHLTFSLLRIL